MPSPSPAAGRPAPLRLGPIIATSLSVWPRLMLAFGPVYALQVLPNVLPAQVGTTQDGGAGLLTMAVADVIGLLIGMVCLGALTTVVVQVLDGEQPRIMAAVQAGLRRFFPVLGACTIAGVVMLLGFILLVVPGLILTTWYFVVVPVCVLEGLGPRATLRRSAALSKGVRWSIFALVALMLVASLLAALCAYAADQAIGGIGAAMVDVLAETAVGILAGTLAVVTYRALGARVKEEAVLF